MCLDRSFCVSVALDKFLQFLFCIVWLMSDHRGRCSAAETEAAGAKVHGPDWKTFFALIREFFTESFSALPPFSLSICFSPPPILHSPRSLLSFLSRLMKREQVEMSIDGGRCINQWTARDCREGQKTGMLTTRKRKDEGKRKNRNGKKEIKKNTEKTSCRNITKLPALNICAVSDVIKRKTSASKGCCLLLSNARVADVK